MATTPPAPTASPRQPRLLTGLGNVQAGPGKGKGRTDAKTFTATLPLRGPGSAPQPVRPAPAPAATAPEAGLPRWAKGVVICGVLLAIAMPVSVLMSRSMLVQETLAAESGSKAAMVCTAGDARAVDDSSILGWLFGGSFFSCGDWETREARVQRERDLAHNNYMARERARQGLPPN